MNDRDVSELVEASSLGAPGAQALRARTTSEQRAAVAQRADRYAAALTAEARAVMEHLDGAAAALPDGGSPRVRLAFQKAREAVAAASAALQVDPTLAAPDRDRDLQLLAELLRQIKPLGRQAEVQLEKERLEFVPGTEKQIARLGRVNPHAMQELTALAARSVEVAAQITEAALPDWDSPKRVRERSARLLLSSDRLEQIAGELRSAVRASLHTPYPDPEAERLAVAADQIVTPSAWQAGPAALAAAARHIERLEQELLTARAATRDARRLARADDEAEARRRTELAEALAVSDVDAGWDDLLQVVRDLVPLMWLGTVVAETREMVEDGELTYEAALRQVWEASTGPDLNDLDDDLDEEDGDGGEADGEVPGG